MELPPAAHAGTPTFARDASGPVVNLPEKKPNDYAYVLDELKGYLR